jgi:hypothetical protein
MVGKFGKLGVAVLVGALAVAAALSVRLANQPPPAFPLPPLPVGDATPDNPADPGGPTKAELASSLNEGREAESAPMAHWPGVARREGDVLTIAAGGRDLASFTDANYCDGFDECSCWRFQGVMTLGGKAYPWLTFFHGEGWEIAYLVTPTGELIGAPGDPVVSPDGRWLVVAFNDPDMAGGVSIFEVRPQGPVLVASGDLGCEAKAWTVNDRLPLTCVVNDQKAQRWMSAELVQRGGVWRVRPVAELDASTKKPLSRQAATLAAPLVEAEVPLADAEDEGTPSPTRSARATAGSRPRAERYLASPDFCRVL